MTLSDCPMQSFLGKKYRQEDVHEQVADQPNQLLEDLMALASLDFLLREFKKYTAAKGCIIYRASNLLRALCEIHVKKPLAMWVVETFLLVPDPGEKETALICQAKVPFDSEKDDGGQVVVSGTGAMDRSDFATRTLNAFLHYVYLATDHSGAFIHEIRGMSF